jgi:hypothetical protein
MTGFGLYGAWVRTSQFIHHFARVFAEKRHAAYAAPSAVAEILFVGLSQMRGTDGAHYNDSITLSTAKG